MTETILALLVAIRVVESTDGLDLKAKGNDYQITSVCVQDVNRIYRTNYKWPEDVRDRETAENIILLYLTYYGMQYQKDYGRVPTAKVLAKIYHLGYEGFQRGGKRGEKYWGKIKEAKRKYNVIKIQPKRPSR